MKQSEGKYANELIQTFKNITMQPSKAQMILRSKASIFNTKFDSMQVLAAEQAMIVFANDQIDEFSKEQNKEVAFEAVKLFPALVKKQFILWLRKKSFLLACKEAQLRADTEGFKCFVIRSSRIGYTILNTLDIDLNKKIRVLGKDVDAIELEKTASFTATRKVHPPVLKRR